MVRPTDQETIHRKEGLLQLWNKCLGAPPTPFLYWKLDAQCAGFFRALMNGTSAPVKEAQGELPVGDSVLCE